MQFYKERDVRLWTAVLCNPKYGDIALHLARVAGCEDEKAYQFAFECLTRYTGRPHTVVSGIHQARNHDMPDMSAAVMLARLQPILIVATTTNEAILGVCSELARVAAGFRDAQTLIAPGRVPIQSRQWVESVDSLRHELSAESLTYTATVVPCMYAWPQAYNWHEWRKIEYATREGAAAVGVDASPKLVSALRAYMPAPIDRLKLLLSFGSIKDLEIEPCEYADMLRITSDLLADASKRALYGDAFLYALQELMSRLTIDASPYRVSSPRRSW